MVSRTWLGQPAFGRPTLTWIHAGEFQAVGLTGRTAFRAPIRQLRLRMTSLGNLRIRGSSGTEITLVPSDPRGTPIADRMLRYLPPEVADSPGAREVHDDPLDRQVIAGFKKDASGPTRRIADALVEQGATLERAKPYSRWRVWTIALSSLVVLLAIVMSIVFLVRS